MIAAGKHLNEEIAWKLPGDAVGISLKPSHIGGVIGGDQEGANTAFIWHWI